MNTFNQQLGQRIRARRRAASLSQESLGGALDVSQATISNAENGKSDTESIFGIYDQLVRSGLTESRTAGGAYRVGRLKN